VACRLRRFQLHSEAEDWPRCQIDADAMLARAPDSPYGRDQAQAATTDDERAAALRLIGSSAELDAENHEAWARAAYRLREAGAPGQAIPYITRAIELAPDNADYLDERATCLRGAAPHRGLDPVGFRASVVAALADAEQAIALSNDEDLELYRHRASLREEAGDLEGALADQTQMIEMAPDFLDAYADRARLRKLTGDMPGALADAARVTAMEDETFAELAAFVDVGKMQRFNLDDV
jgi:tetratricopeptide (TPR) repeat protein